MAKILKVKYPDRYNGCELCVLEVQRQLKKVGIEGALIRVFKNHKEPGQIVYAIELDQRVNNMDMQKIRQICPKEVYEIEESENAGLTK